MTDRAPSAAGGHPPSARVSLRSEQQKLSPLARGTVRASVSEAMGGRTGGPGLVDLASPADDPALRALLREVPVPGAVRLSYEREPWFFDADAALGDRVVTLAGRLAPGAEPVAVVSRASRVVFVGGEPTRVGYVGGLRARPDRPVRTLVGQGWTQLRALHDADPVALTTLAVTAENDRIRRLLSLARGDAPALTPVADVVTLAFFVHRRHRPPAPTPAGVADAVRQSLGPRRDLFPADPLALPGLSPTDDIAVDGAALSLWDASSVRQSVVRGYQGALGRLRPLVNGALRVLGAAPLPDTGEPLRAAFAVRPVWRDPQALDALVGAALGTARARGLAFVLLGLDARDPALPLLRRRLHVAYRSTLVAARWPGDDPPALSSPIHVQIASY